MRSYLAAITLAFALSAAGCATSSKQQPTVDPRKLVAQGRYHEAMRQLPRRMEELHVREAEAGHSFEGAAGLEYATVMFTVAESGGPEWAAILDDPEIPYAYKTEMLFEIIEARLGKGAIYVGNAENFVVPRRGPVDLATQKIELPNQAPPPRLQLPGGARNSTAPGAVANTATAPSERADQILRSLLVEAQQLVRKRGLSWYAADVAAALAEVGQVDAAEAVFELVPLTDRSGDVRIRLLATGYARNGDLDRTRQTISRIRDAEQDYANQRQLAWFQAGQAFAAARRTDAAQEALREAAAAVDDSEGVYHQGKFLAEVAEAQYENGDVAESAETFARAVRVAAADGRESLRFIGLKEIAARQTKLGLLNDALDTASRIDVVQDREYAWRTIAETLAASGRMDDARQLLQKIDRPWTAMATALALSDAYVKAGRVSDAAKMLDHAEAAWQREAGADARISMALRLADSHAATGNVDAAAEWLQRSVGEAEATMQPAGGPGPFAILKEIETVPGASARQGQFRSIGVAQARLGLVEEARQSFERAMVAAQGHQPGVWRTTAIWVVAKSQAAAGLPDDAMRTMETLPEADRRWLVYVDIASSMARAGRLDEALQLVHARGGGIGGMSYVAKALLKAGDLENALRVALQGSGSHFVLRSIAQRYAVSGDVRPVLDALDNVTESDKRMPLILGLVDGILERSRGLARSQEPSPSTAGNEK